MKPVQTEAVRDVVVAQETQALTEALYVDGNLIDENETIYASDIADAVGNSLIRFSFVKTVLGENPWPDSLDCIEVESEL